MTLGVCDDNLVDIENITKMVRRWSAEHSRADIRVQSFTSPYALLDAVEKGEIFDVFLLDILMPEMTGIGLGERLHELLSEPLLIFLTTSEDYYPDAFRLYAFQYLCKPLRDRDLFSVLDKTLAHCVKRASDAFLLKTAGGLVRIPLHSIVYVELLSHVCYVHLADGRHLESTYLRTGFDNFAEPLLQHRRFVKTHTSYVVNLEFVGKLSVGNISLTTGKDIPMARAFAKGVQQSYIAYGLREEGLL